MQNQTKMFVSHAGQWKPASQVYTGKGGQWVPQRLRMVGKNGRWQEVFSNEIPSNPLFEITGLSYRAGAALQGQLEITGPDMYDLLSPLPAVGAYYPLRGSYADYLENFGSCFGAGDEAPIAVLEDGTPSFYVDASKHQYLSLPTTGGGLFDLLGLMGNDGAASFEPRGKKYWEIGFKVKPKAMPTEGAVTYLFWSGTLTQHICVWMDSGGALHARFKNNEYEKVLSHAAVASLNQWVGILFIHRPVATTRYLDFHVLRDTGDGYEALTQSVEADLVRDISGVAYNEFSYWVPAPNLPLELGKGEISGGIVTAEKFFLEENTHEGLTISSDGFEVSIATNAYRSAVPSGWMAPDTGSYYIEVLNRTSYDVQIGFTDLLSPDLSQPAGIQAWCINTIAGRRFSKQTGGGTNWSSAIPSNSVIGLLYDSTAGNFEVFVNGVSRGKPFTPGTITGPVRFIISTRGLLASGVVSVPRVSAVSSQWAHQPAGSYASVPFQQTISEGGFVFASANYRDLFVRNEPMNSLDRSLALLDPSVSMNAYFKNITTNEEFLVNEYILKMADGKIIMSVPELPAGNYLIQCRLSNYGESTPRFFTISEFPARNTPLYLNFETSPIKDIQKELIAAHKQWGGLNGGVVADNVVIDRVNGVCELTACGNTYAGPVLGVDRHGKPSGFNTRIGACIVTRDYFGPGSYRIVAKPAQREGVCNAFWSFHYEEAYPGSVLYARHLADGLHTGGTEEDGLYTVRNHEIDIEFPTALKTNPNQEDVSFYHARLNTWRGELRNWDVPNNDVPVGTSGYSETNDPEYWSEYTDDFVNLGVNLADGNYHEFRYDWHLGEDARVDFYIDGIYHHTVRTHVPDIPGRYWAGLWFPSGSTQWAGRNANWDFEKMLVKSLEIIPFTDQLQYARLVTETYPDDVFRGMTNIRK